MISLLKYVLLSSHTLVLHLMELYSSIVKFQNTLHRYLKIINQQNDSIKGSVSLSQISTQSHYHHHCIRQKPEHLATEYITKYLMLIIWMNTGNTAIARSLPMLTAYTIQLVRFVIYMCIMELQLVANQLATQLLNLFIQLKTSSKIQNLVTRLFICIATHPQQ